jgi:hypothetical protein
LMYVGEEADAKPFRPHRRFPQLMLLLSACEAAYEAEKVKTATRMRCRYAQHRSRTISTRRGKDREGEHFVE